MKTGSTFIKVTSFKFTCIGIYGIIFSPYAHNGAKQQQYNSFLDMTIVLNSADNKDEQYSSEGLGEVRLDASFI